MYPANYSAKDTAITSRPSSTALLCIDAADRFKDYAAQRAIPPGASPVASAYDFTITRASSLMNGFFTRVAVSEVVFPWLVPNINARTTQIKFQYAPNPGAPSALLTITLDKGFYTPAALAARLQQIIRAIDPPNLGAFTMTYGVQTINVAVPVSRPVFEYKTNNGGATVVRFEPMATTDTTGFYNVNRKELFDLLGFNDYNITYNDANLGDATLCQYTRYVDIVCPQLTNNQALKDTMTQITARDTICRVYLGDSSQTQATIQPANPAFCPVGCAPFTIYQDYTVPKYIQWLPNSPIPGFMRFTVFDEDGFPLADTENAPLDRANDWSLTMLVSEN